MIECACTSRLRHCARAILGSHPRGRRLIVADNLSTPRFATLRPAATPHPAVTDSHRRLAPPQAAVAHPLRCSLPDVHLFIGDVSGGGGWCTRPRYSQVGQRPVSPLPPPQHPSPSPRCTTSTRPPHPTPVNALMLRCSRGAVAGAYFSPLCALFPLSPRPLVPP